jgi:gamma-glutamyl hercynylcysteine S-oxide synthase
MAARAPTAQPHSPDAERALQAMAEVRDGTFALLSRCSDEQLAQAHSPIMSPLVWDLGHIAAYEELWVAHRHGGRELLRADLASLYDAFETPRAVRAEVELLDPEQARSYLAEVRVRVAEVLEDVGLGDGVICEMVLRHELQHRETMRQTLAIAGLLPAGEPPAAHLGAERGWSVIPAGPFMMGAGEEGFSYDNERPRHKVDLGAFSIARLPVSNASWMHFSEGGGYVRREWWSDEGWAWKEEFDITHHPDVADGEPDAPVSHVSWFEADAFARAHEARLPSEAEWEKAATWTQGRIAPLAGAGYAWEWTASRFGGYPGFRAHPYREYSEVFFGGDYRVLRGGSWATDPRVATPTFRNWDLPQRRQIFAGVRLAREA